MVIRESNKQNFGAEEQKKYPTMSSLKDGWQLIDGVEIHYVMGGSGKKVLLLHGWGGSIYSWKPVLDDLLSKGFQVLALDFPGFGQSTLPPASWGVCEYAQCLQKFLIEVNFSPTDIVAHSFGGRVAIVLTSSWPNLVRHLVLVASAGIRINSFGTQILRLVTKFGKLFFSLPGLFKLREQARAKLYTYLEAEDYLQAGDMKNIFINVVEQDLREHASKISVPTLLIWGNQDTETPIAQARILESCIPDSGLIVFPGAGHFCYLEQFSKFSAILAEFFKD